MRNKTKKFKDYYFSQIEIMKNVIENDDADKKINCSLLNSIQTLPRDNLKQKSFQIFDKNEQKCEYDQNSNKTIQDLDITLREDSIKKVIYFIFLNK